MDLRLHARVLWRFRFLVAVGLLAAIVLALMAFVRVTIDQGRAEFAYRQPETWSSDATLFVTQSGFPWGRSVPEMEVLPANPKLFENGVVQRFAEPDRFSTLAVLYSHLASGDAVRNIILRSGPLDGDVEATALATRDNGYVPLIRITGLAASGQRAKALTQRAILALTAYVRQQQTANAIREGERVVVSVLRRPAEPELLEGRKLTRPIVVFLLITMVTLSIAFLLESMRPRVTQVPGNPLAHKSAGPS